MARIVYRPNPGEIQPFHFSEARWRALFGGRGSGKTVGGAIEVIRKVHERPGWPGAVIAPDFKHFYKSTWPEWSRWIPWSEVVQHHQTQNWILFRNGTKVYYGGIDEPEAWRGPNVNWFWFDEAGRKADQMAFNIMIGTCRIGPEPCGWVTTTPAGKYHWLYDLFVKKVVPPGLEAEFARLEAEGIKLYDKFHITIEDNKAHLDPLFYLSLKAAYTGRWARQEIYGEFVAFEGQVYDNWADGPDGNVTSEAEYQPGWNVEAWYDDGYAEGHPRVILLVQEAPGGDLNIFAEYYKIYQFEDESIEEVLGWERQLGWKKPSVAYGDPSAASFKGRLWSHDIETVGVTAPLTERIKNLRTMICDARGHRRLKIHPRCVNFNREMNAYRFPEPGRGIVKAGSQVPLKEDDHCPDAAGYGCWNRRLDL